MTELRLPYFGRISFTSPYGWRTLNGVPGWHGGIDLVGLDDKVIRAPADGVIGVSAMIPREGDTTRTWEWGNYIRLDTDGEDGMRIYLCHMERRLVAAGRRVRAGDPVGIEGDTGYSFGPHCHLEVRREGGGIDPTPLLGIENRAGVLLFQAPYGGTGAAVGTGAAAGTGAAVGSAASGGNGAEAKDEKPFSGVFARWYDEALRWAVENGIIRGTGGGNLAPDEPCTRAMAAQMLYNYHRMGEGGSEKSEK